MKKRAGTALILLALWSAPAFAQGCAMCYQSAEQAGAKAQAALRRGILMLLIPTLTVMGGMVGAVVYFGNSKGAPAAELDPEQAYLRDDVEPEEVLEEEQV